MEKLIELLLECKPQIHYLDKPKGIYDKKYGIGWYKREGDVGGWFSEELIISKKFGFIKRLVENDKIDLDACEGEKTYNNLTTSRDSNYTQYERLLMALAIQDEPIRFLCEILK